MLPPETHDKLDDTSAKLCIPLFATCAEQTEKNMTLNLYIIKQDRNTVTESSARKCVQLDYTYNYNDLVL